MRGLISVVFFTLTISSIACECHYQSMEQNWRKADFVVQIRVHEIRDSLYFDIGKTLSYSLDPNYLEVEGFHVLLDVKQTFKGNVGSSIEIIPNWSNCDFRFDKSREYMIFGYIDSLGNHKTNICWSNFSLDSTEKLNQFKKVIDK